MVEVKLATAGREEGREGRDECLVVCMLHYLGIGVSCWRLTYGDNNAGDEEPLMKIGRIDDIWRQPASTLQFSFTLQPTRLAAWTTT